MLADAKDGAARNACFTLKACRFLPSPGGAPHLADDATRDRWLTETAGFIESRARDHVVAAAPVKN
jgi:hypothetical protein